MGKGVTGWNSCFTTVTLLHLHAWWMPQLEMKQTVAPKTPGLYQLDVQTKVLLYCILLCFKRGISMTFNAHGNLRERKVILAGKE